MNYEFLMIINIRANKYLLPHCIRAANAELLLYFIYSSESYLLSNGQSSRPVMWPLSQGQGHVPQIQGHDKVVTSALTLNLNGIY